MINKDELIYKLDVVIEYLKNNGGYDYKLYNHICPDMGEPDSNIVNFHLKFRFFNKNGNKSDYSII